MNRLTFRKRFDNEPVLRITACVDEHVLHREGLYSRAHDVLVKNYLTGSVIDKLADYEDAEEMGLLLRLPCKAKSIVYLLDHSFVRRKNKPFKCEVDEFIVADDGCYAVLNGAENFYMTRRFRATKIHNFGNTIFLTEEEAEAALKKKQEGENNDE